MEGTWKGDDHHSVCYGPSLCNEAAFLIAQPALSRHARVLVSGIQVDGRRIMLSSALDSRQIRAGMTFQQRLSSLDDAETTYGN
ncbi:hypothetical protein TFLX_03637 [Thermoflexales bacterium]|nr:hypothetical protein TFLX_03637 [Thermoflexales bacterium]